MGKDPNTIKLDECRQARRIHGGLWQLGVALLGITLSWVRIPSKRLRLSRAVEVLEHLGSAEARQVLEQVAQQGLQTWLVTEAQAALQRLRPACGG